MNIGVIGAGADKFTPKQRAKARALIHDLLPDGSTVVSGRSPVGGIDVDAEEEADLRYLNKHIYAPEVDQWSPPGQYGFRARNLDIVEDSDIVHVITVKEYPPGYEGRRWEYCYHCIKARPEHATDHVKGGGCWTGIKAMEAGKQVIWHVLE